MDNQQYVAHTVPRESNVESIRGARFLDRVVVFSFASGLRRDKSPTQEQYIRAFGLAFGLDAENGRLAWPHPANLIDYVIPMNQPRFSPYLAGYRSSLVNNKASLALMDVRDGSLAFSAENFDVQLPDVMDSFLRFRMTTDPITHALEINISNTKFALQASNDEGPPQPPFWSSPARSARTVRTP
jgi:hypothetical protein